MSGLAALVFDGRCRFCTWAARFIARRTKRVIRLVPYQLLSPGEYGFGADEAASTAWWVTEHGTCFAGHRAIALALTTCGAPWRGLGRLLVRPPMAPFAALAYALVARIRHRLPGVGPALPVAT